MGKTVVANRPRRVGKTSERIASVLRDLQRGEVRRQKCPLHVGRQYRHARTGKTVTFLGLWLTPKGGWAGSVRVQFVGEQSPRPVALASLTPLNQQEGQDAA